MDENTKNMQIVLGDGERPEFLAQGIEWLMKMGYMDSPDVQTSLTANLYVISDRIIDVALVADTDKMKILAYLELEAERKPRFHNKVIGFLKRVFNVKVPQIEELSVKEIGTIAADKLHQVLPNYDIRVTFNRELYKKSREIADKLSVLRGGESS